jgi:hypothetical protein
VYVAEYLRESDEPVVVPTVEAVTTPLHAAPVGDPAEIPVAAEV